MVNTLMLLVTGYRPPSIFGKTNFHMYQCTHTSSLFHLLITTFIVLLIRVDLVRLSNLSSSYDTLFSTNVTRQSTVML